MVEIESVITCLLVWIVHVSGDLRRTVGVRASFLTDSLILKITTAKEDETSVSTITNSPQVCTNIDDEHLQACGNFTSVNLCVLLCPSTIQPRPKGSPNFIFYFAS